MKSFVPFLLTVSLCFAGGIPSQNIRGEYIEARTADVYTGPCFANSEAGLVGEFAVFGWKIDKGSWQGVSLDGLSVVGAVKASGTLGDIFHDVYPVKSILIIDDKATPEQRYMHSMKATLTAGTLAKIQTRAMNEGDHICRNEEVWYQPLTKTTHAMPVYAMAHTFTGQGLGSTWSSPDKRSSFIGNFAVPSE